ncbi:MAG: hypothetical protein O9320_14050 [Magnetospirillum sp.]|nr:hypothetical protein [Magnetospirillum sp.]
MAVAAITADASFQVRAKIDGGKVHEYATAMRVGAVFPPVRLARINGALFLIDGWHRLAAQERRAFLTKDREEGRGLEFIAATIEDMSEKDARFAAATANLKHGLPMKPRERRKVFALYMRQQRYRNAMGQPKSTRKIAEELGGIAAHTTIWTWIKRGYPRVAEQMKNPETQRRAGVEPPRPFVPPSLFPKDARGHLEAARKAVRGVVDPEERRAILEEVRQLDAELRGEWTGIEVEPEDF